MLCPLPGKPFSEIFTPSPHLGLLKEDPRGRAPSHSLSLHYGHHLGFNECPSAMSHQDCVHPGHHCVLSTGLIVAAEQRLVSDSVSSAGCGPELVPSQRVGPFWGQALCCHCSSRPATRARAPARGPLQLESTLSSPPSTPEVLQLRVENAFGALSENSGLLESSVRLLRNAP